MTSSSPCVQCSSSCLTSGHLSFVVPKFYHVTHRLLKANRNIFRPHVNPSFSRVSVSSSLSGTTEMGDT